MNLGKSVQMNEEYVQVDVMHGALRAIANEVQRFHSITTTYIENDEIIEKLIKCKSNLKLKKKQVHKLKENLKIACDIAKIVISAKENAAGLLKSHLILAKNEGAELFEKQSKNIEIINSLTIENKILRDRIQDIESSIALGYKELQKIPEDPVNESSVVMQMKKLIISCGQHYTDYYNEHEKCMQLEQTNRFLYNKIIILENTIEAISEELRNLRYHNSRLHKENSFMKDKYVGTKTLKSIDNQTILPKEVPSNITIDEHPLETQIYALDLTSHLCTVKKLLNDQDSLLEDLRDISQECCVV